MPTHTRMVRGLSELHALLRRENGTDLLQNLHAERDRLSEELLHLRRLRGGVTTVQRELPQVGLRGVQRLPRLLLLVAMPLPKRPLEKTLHGPQ